MESPWALYGSVASPKMTGFPAKPRVTTDHIAVEPNHKFNVSVPPLFVNQQTSARLSKSERMPDTGVPSDKSEVGVRWGS